MEKQNQQLKSNRNSKKFRINAGGGNLFLIIFAALFVAMIVRSFMGGDCATNVGKWTARTPAGRINFFRCFTSCIRNKNDGRAW